MTMEDESVDWFLPTRRALFPMEGIHISRSLAKVLKSNRFEVRFDTAFEATMRGCLRPQDNWISEDFIRVYTLIHFEGWAHSAECWLDGDLVGGVYGLALGGCFCAESMFHRVTNASKVALHAMIDNCRRLGFTVFDAQLMNPHLQSLGAFEVSNRKYQKMLQEALKIQTPWSR